MLVGNHGKKIGTRACRGVNAMLQNCNALS